MSRIVLWVSDLNRQADFYSALLSAPIAQKSDEFASVSDQTNSVLLHLLPEQFRAPSGTLSPAQEEVAIKPIFVVDSIDAAIARTEKYQLRKLGNLSHYNNNAYHDCIDPEGNVFQISKTK